MMSWLMWNDVMYHAIRRGEYFSIVNAIVEVYQNEKKTVYACARMWDCCLYSWIDA